MLYLLLVTMTPEGQGRTARALEHFNRGQGGTPLFRAILGRFRLGAAVPPPPTRIKGRAPGRRPRVMGSARSVLLSLGADPRQRVRAGDIDWTPLAVAVAIRAIDLVDLLVMHGANVNARWPPVDLSRDAHPVQSGCARGTGTAPLMLAASLGV